MCTFALLTLISVIGCSCIGTSSAQYNSTTLLNFANSYYKVLKEKYEGNMVTSPLGAAELFVANIHFADLGNNSLSESVSSGIVNEMFMYHSNIEGRTYAGVEATLPQTQGLELYHVNRYRLKQHVYIPRLYREVMNAYQRIKSFSIGNQSLDMNSTITRMNEEISTLTNGTMQDAISSNDIEESDSIFLINVMRFKGLWKQQFDESSTTYRPFCLSENNCVDVPMMHTNSLLELTSDDNCKAWILRLPYQDDRFEMIIVLPHENVTLAEVEEKMSLADIWEKLNGHLRSPVSLYLPKFKIEASINLGDILNEMGLGTLSELVLDPPMQVSKIKQKVFFEVDEKGADKNSTNTFVNSEGMDIPNKLDLNRPFLAIVRYISLSRPFRPLTVLTARITDPRMKYAQRKAV